MFLVAMHEVPEIQKSCSVQISSIEDLDLPRITYTLSLMKYNFIYENFQNIIEKLFPAGITQYLTEQHKLNFYGRISEIDENIFKILKLKDFKFVAFMFVALCGFSIILFTLEYISSLKEKLMKILRF